MAKTTGKNVVRKEGVAKVRGEAKYVDDINLPDQLYGLTIRHPGPRGKIKSIQFEAGAPWSEIVVVGAKDIPGHNHVALIENDQPYLADGVINHPEEAVLLLAHKDKEVLLRAQKLVKIEFENLLPVLSIKEALSKQTIIWGKDNTYKEYLVKKGDTAKAFENAFHIVEGEYQTGAQEQLYIEPNGVIAQYNDEEGVTVWGSMQCPYYVHKALMPLFNLPPEKVRVVQTETGGGFGGKEEYPSMIAGHAALLAYKSRKPVKMIYDRAEDMAATTKRHPSITKHRTALSKDGKILALEIDFTIDGGAYMTLSPVVLSRGTIHAAGPYFCENVLIRAKAVATNTVPHGAFRGFGAPQSLFALERHLDVIANEIKMDPVILRKKNLLKPNQTTATGQTIHEPIELGRLLDHALKKTKFNEKRKKFSRLNASQSQIKKGIGLACFLHGAGFTGSGERYLASIVGVEATKEGKFRILSSSTEIGQGTNTIFSQIAADALGVNYEDILVQQPDTRLVPNSGPTVASRTCMIVGGLVRKACENLIATLIESGVYKKGGDIKKAIQNYLKNNPSLKAVVQYEQPENIFWDDQNYRGDAYGAYAWAVYVAEVTTDLTTYETKLDDFYALQEVGEVVHPILARGQIEGGVAQAIGFSLYEKVVYRNGRMMNNQMTNYIMPTAVDLPPIRAEFFQFKKKGKVQKGIGELPMDGPGPAIMNAVAFATGLNPKHIPFLPEDLAELMA